MAVDRCQEGTVGKQRLFPVMVDRIFVSSSESGVGFITGASGCTIVPTLAASSSSL